MINFICTVNPRISLQRLICIMIFLHGGLIEGGGGGGGLFEGGCIVVILRIDMGGC